MKWKKREKMATGVAEKKEAATMVMPEARDLVMGEEAMITAGREVDLEVASRKLLANGSLL